MGSSATRFDNISLLALIMLTIQRNKLGLNWAKLSSNWDWTLTLLQFTCIKLISTEEKSQKDQVVTTSKPSKPLLT